MIRTVTDTIYKVTGDPDDITGEPWVGARVRFRLRPGSYAPDGTHPPDEVIVVTDEQGRIAVGLWCNAEGETPTLYGRWIDPATGATTDALTAHPGGPYTAPVPRAYTHLMSVRDGVTLAHARLLAGVTP